MQMYTDNSGATVVKGPRIPPISGHGLRQNGITNINITHNDQTLTKELLEVIRPVYQVRANVKTWYATLHIAGNIDVAKALIQKRILNEGACYQVTATDYVYSGGCEQGMTIRCIHYPRFPAIGPEILLERLIILAAELAIELGQKSYTIETPDRTTYFDNGTKNG